MLYYNCAKEKENLRPHQPNGKAIERRMTMIREMLNAHAMNILMSEDVNEPSLRVRPHRKNRILRQKEKNSEANENFLRMLSGKQGYMNR